MKKTDRISRKVLCAGAALMAAACFCIWQNNDLVITESEHVNQKIPAEFDGFTIAQISDLHNKEFGRGQKRLLSHVADISPDIIVITGDLIDRRKYDLGGAMEFIEGALAIAPVFYVSGNHEAWSGKYADIQKSLVDAGVSVLHDEEVEITRGESSIKILGVADPDFLTSKYREGTDLSRITQVLKQHKNSGNGFKILLSHRPELFDLYCKSEMDLIFTGHAHGGQIRLPFFGALIVPDQGLFPEYSTGSYTKGSSTMYVSRGLGNSLFPARVFNRPEIVAVTLRSTLSRKIHKYKL